MSNLTEIAESQLHGQHYLKHVTELGDAHPIVATQDIHATTGLKLVSRGVRFDSRLYEQLLNHKLMPQLDQCLAAEDTVTVEQVVRDAGMMLVDEKLLAEMRASLPGDRGLLQAVGGVTLAPGAAFKLTVMRERRPDLYQHSLFITLVSVYVGIKAGMDEAQLMRLATAALLHDVGILHVDPQLFERTHRMSEEERRHLYVHPVTAYLILEKFQEYPQEVLEAVLQHHERLDGSGYPQGLKEAAINRLAQIIAVAEIVASRNNREAETAGSLRLETMLKINSHRYGRELIGHLKAFYSKERLAPQSIREDKAAVLVRLQRISSVLKQWEVICECCHANPLIGKFINDRMQELRRSMLATGFDPDAAETFIAGAEDDPQTLMEARIFAEEITWQVSELFHEIRRRWPALDSDEAAEITVLTSWMAEVKQLISA
jgi:HD-GYP domain-containing protein (c-di-GMP phosphodiesterase class II)